MPWAISDMGEDGIHIVPTDEIHLTENCTCGATMDEDGLWVHSSFDGRESFESGARKPS